MNQFSNGASGGNGSEGSKGGDGYIILYYNDNTRSVTFDTKGGSTVPTQDIEIGTTVTEPAPPTQAGYEFSGWYADEACTIFYDFNTPVSNDITIYAKWLPRNDTPYKVQHYQQDVSGSGYTLFETEHLTGTTGTDVSAAAKEYPGFHENAGHMDRLASGTIAPNGSTTLRLYYDRDSHSVTFDSAGGSAVDAQSVRYGANAALPTQPTRQGYQFADWYANQAQTAVYDFDSPIVKDIIIYAGWAPLTNTPYQVQHYWLGDDGKTYTVKETETLTGTTEAVASAVPKQYEGYHENTEYQDRLAFGAIAPDGSTVLRLYYDWNTYTVIFETGSGSSVSAQGLRHGALASQPVPPVRQGYDFNGWYADQALSIGYDFHTPVTRDTTLYAGWTPRSDTAYQVRHFQQNADGNGYALKDTDELSGTTGSTVSAAAKNYTGFHEATNHPDRLASGTVVPDGSLVLSLYYDRNVFTVSFQANGGSVSPEEQIMAYGAAYGMLPVPEREGFTFSGWYTDADFGDQVTEQTVPENVAHTLYAHWMVADSGTVGGVVVDDGDQPVPNAKVTIRAGTVDYKVTYTDAEGKFSISNVAFDTYNLIAEKNGIITTTIIHVSAAAQDYRLSMPAGKTNSVLIVEDGSPEIVVGGLDELYGSEEFYPDDEQAVVAGGGNVVVTMDIAEKAEANVEKAAEIKKAANGQEVALYLDASVTKTVTPADGDSEVQVIKELPQLLQIIVPLDEGTRENQGYTVYQVHEGEINAITETPNDAGEYLTVGGDKITVFARKFSVYCLTYTKPSSGGSSGNSGLRFDDVRPPDWFYQDVMDAVKKGYMEGITQTTFRPNDPFTRAQAAYAFAKMAEADLNTVAGQTDFNDVTALTHYGQEIFWADAAGVAIGYGDGRFGPKDGVTREQLALMLYRQYGKNENPAWNKEDFTDAGDVSPWAETAVHWAVSTGLLEGTDNKEIVPQGTVSRAEAAAMLLRAARLK
ncbi:MAG: InlB B-repeat-containing protein [Pseudoflavonifractor sp.]|nr:InlB B-repeat-containing protein [Pseudoflavonifractor sp.]